MLIIPLIVFCVMFAIFAFGILFDLFLIIIDAIAKPIAKAFDCDEASVAWILIILIVVGFIIAHLIFD